MLEENRCLPGNGNGNKMNLRVEILEGLLASLNDTTSAKMNSLRQTIRRNQMDQADTTRKSLDVMRQVFQADINDEIKQVLDRHMRTTFSPAFENLKRHRLDVSENDMNELCRSILDGAKLCFQPIPQPKNDENSFMDCDSLTPPMKEHGNKFDDGSRRIYESDGGDSDASCMSQTSSLVAQSPHGAGSGMKKRGRPRKTDVDCGRSGSPILSGISPISLDQGAKWDPERIGVNTRYILGSKVNKILGLGHRGHVYSKYPLIFRYVADDEDKAWLFDRNLTTRVNGKVLVMVLDDVQEIAQVENLPGSTLNDLQRCSFLAHELMVRKMKGFMRAPFERLKKRITFPQAMGSFPC
uniref:DNTTIP1_dimer domain-containing protein n=1 Tax=Steinernema glaseri TaxID=37863 RepID=A0A1I8A6B5_9BILA